MSVLKRILKAIGMGGRAGGLSQFRTVDRPYADNSAALIYELLFCDRLDLFRDIHKGPLVPPWSTLFDEDPDLEAVAKIAEDEAHESRVRMLSYNLLRAADFEVPQKKLLGTIIEFGFPGGLDTLAVFTDGGVRYINHTGKMALVSSSLSVLKEEVQQVIAASQPVVAALCPWDKDRPPAPGRGNMRITFLVSDGLYFGEGTIEAMERERMAVPVINAATSLLTKLVQMTNEGELPDAPDKK